MISLLLLFVATVLADYECVCNFEKEQNVYSHPTIIGLVKFYMYEFDCYPTLQNGLRNINGFVGIEKDNQFGFVKLGPNVIVTSCPGPFPTITKITTPITTTPDVLYYYYHCQKVHTINDIATQTISSNTSASVCASGYHSSPEAFVLNHCNTTHPSLWKQGQQIMTDCHAIPTYTPIATFVNVQYLSPGGLSGIFLGCLPTGFKMAIQQCDQPPAIEHIEQGGIYTHNPDMYFTVQ